MILSFDLNEIDGALRALRAHSHKTLQQVSKDTGLSVSFISDMERGRTDPSIDTLRKILTAYQHTVKIIFTPET